MYVVGSNNTNNFEYKVDFEFELQKWLKDTKLYYTDSIYQELGEAFIVGITNTCYTMNNLQLKQGYGILKGSVFEKTEETKYNVKVNLNYKGQVLKSIITNDGIFEFKNLNTDLPYSLEFIDMTNKYNPKSLKDITPILDREQDAQINLFFDAVVGETIDYYFEIYALGTPQLNLINAPSTFSISKVSDVIYRVHGTNTGSPNLNFSIQLDDYRLDGLKTVIKEIKANKK